MSFIKPTVVRFKQSTSPDTVLNRFRIRPANTAAIYDAPFDDVPKGAVDTDGYTRVQQSSIPKIAGLEGKFDIHITAVDARGNESDFLQVDNVNLDLGAPTPPTDGAIE